MSAAAIRTSRRLLLLGGFASLAAPAALAHRSQSVFTTVSWNGAASMIEVTHRLHSDDAEIGLASVSGAASMVDLTVVESQARLALYIETRFSLATAQGPIALEILGAEIENREILIHQQAATHSPPSELTVENRILRDVFDGQTNLVNIRMAARTRTLIFSGGDGPKLARDLT
ncbi:MAG: DUF6702 family protein [Alphaproteobacteria bacterium]|nr:DUF6702 family protein [Alphaproteobacteria bacterium]